MSSQKFGPAAGISNKDYVLYTNRVSKDPTSELESLLGHSLGSPNQNLTEALTYTTVEMRDGKVMPVTRVNRAAQETSRTYTIGILSALWTPVMERSFLGCKSDFYLKYLCPEDRIFNHVDILPEAYLNPAIEAEDPITNGEETAIITFTSEMQTPRKLRLWLLGYDIVFTDGTTPANDIAFNTEDCPGCGESFALSMISVGGAAGVAEVPRVVQTGDRYSTTSVLLTGAPVADAAYAVYSEGDIRLVAAGTGAFSSATAGDLYRSADAGTTWAAVSGVTAVIARIAKAANMLIAVGKDATGDAVLLYSSDAGVTWTLSASTALPVAEALVDVAYDEMTSRIYVVGNAATLLTGRFSGSALSLTDISANLPGSPTALNAVAVLGKNRVIVGGATAYVAQTGDGGVTWAALAIGGSATVTSIAGNEYRTIVASGAKLFERSALTNNYFSEIVLENGQAVSGTYTRVVMSNDSDKFNRFAAVTTGGSHVFGKPFYPNA